MLSDHQMLDVFYRLFDIGDMPLASPSDLAVRWTTDEAGAGRTLERLGQAGFVDYTFRGNTRRQQRRYWITPEGSDLIYDSSHIHASLDDLRDIYTLSPHESPSQSRLDEIEEKFEWGHRHGPYGDNADHVHAPWTATIAGIREICLRLPLAEQVYPIAPKLLLPPHVERPPELPEDIRITRLSRLRWLRAGRLYHIVAQYGDNFWVAFTYVGVHAKGVVIRDKKNSQFEGLARYAWPPQSKTPTHYDLADDNFEPAPSLHVIVAADGWASALATEHVGAGALSSDIWRSRKPGEPVRPQWSRSLLTDRVRTERFGVDDPHAKNGIHGWLESRPDLAAIDNVPAFRLVMCVSEFPAMNRPELKALTRASGAVFGRTLGALCEAGVVFEDNAHFHLGRQGIQYAADLSRTSVEVVKGTCGRWLDQGQRDRYHKHNRGVAELALAFFRSGGQLVGGWRGTTNLPGVTQVQPDALIELAAGPFGPGWYRVEYERSAVGGERINRKQKMYRRAALAGEPLPVLWVCQRDIAVRRILEKGEGLPTAATTLALATAGAIDGNGVWRTLDGPARISCR